MIRWAGELSVECGVLLIADHRRAVVARPALRAPRSRWLTAGWLVLVLGHYADVTTPALYGRDINLYWDVRYMPDVAAMIARAAPLWLIVGVVAAVAAVLALLYVVFRWALRRVAAAAFDAQGARADLHGRGDGGRLLRGPAARLAFREPARLRDAGGGDLRAPGASGRRGAERLAHARAQPADGCRPGAGAEGADVFLVFIESYGAIAFERPDMAPQLAAARADLDRPFTAPAATWSRRWSSRRPSADRRGWRT